LSSIQDNTTKSVCGCDLDWSRIEAFQGGRVRPRQSYPSTQAILQAFHDYCIIDLQLQDVTACNHVRNVRRVIHHTRKFPQSISRSDLRSYLKTYLSKHPTTYANQIKTLRRFFRDFLNKGHLVHSFKFPSIGYTPKIVPSKTQLQQFYTALDTNRDKALFLLYATTGLRKSEVVSLTLKDINRSQRMIFPNNHGHSVTKRSWISFYNHEAEHALETARARIYHKNARPPPRCFH
jgi:integrase